MDFRKAKYILPNLFTLASVCAGVFSIHLSTTAQTLTEMTMAAWLIVIAMFCDTFDGRVARMTRTESELGIQLDSLADAISFGVAPAFLLYHWGLADLGPLGLLLAAAYVACAVLRLARFNVLANQNPKSQRYFLGLPTPLAAGTVVSVVLAQISYTGAVTTGASLSVAALTLMLSGLMVSNVRYRTFKDINWGGRTIFRAFMFVGLIVGASILFQPGLTFVTIMVAYVVLGLGGGVISLGKHIFGNNDLSKEEVDTVLELERE